MKVTNVPVEDIMVNCNKHKTAIVDLPTSIGEGTKIWHWTHVRENARIGRNCSIGQCCYIDTGANIGDRVRIQNGVSIYKGVVIEDDVFIGPGVTFINVRNPWTNKPVEDKDYEPTIIRRGASIGANATILCGVTIGEGAAIGCGSVVNRNIPPNVLAVGNPARVVKALNEKYGERETS